MEQALTKGWSRVAQGARSLVRQLAAAVYVLIATGLLTQWIGVRLWLAIALEPTLTLLAGFIMGSVVSGPWWTSHLVGVFVGLLDLTLVLLFPGMLQEHSILALIVGPLVTALVGAIGARMAIWRLARKRA